MEKGKHDEYSAQKRKVQYDKIWFRKVIELLKKENLRTGMVTDVGAGRGEFLELVKRMNFFDRHQAIDYAETNISSLKERGFKTFKLDLENWTDNDLESIEKSEVVVSLEVVEHVFNTDDFLSFLNQVTKKDGYLIISTPNMGSFAYKAFCLFRGYPVGEGHHIRFFSKRRLIQYAYFAGFDYVRSNNYSSYATDVVKRGFGIKNQFLAKLISRAIFLKASFLDVVTFNKFNFSDNGLVILFKKVDNNSIGFDSNSVESRFNLLSEPEKKIWRERIEYFLERGYLREHVHFPKKLKNILAKENEKG